MNERHYSLLLHYCLLHQRTLFTVNVQLVPSLDEYPSLKVPI